jgi:pimeloyl-ACP methyl ester carboxylesterase
VYQLLAGLGWTSLPFLPLIRQQTLILAGSDDPIIPLVNARIMRRLLPHADLLIYDDRHLGLLTRAPELGKAVSDFLQHGSASARRRHRARFPQITTARDRSPPA